MTSSSSREVSGNPGMLLCRPAAWARMGGADVVALVVGQLDERRGAWLSARRPL